MVLRLLCHRGATVGPRLPRPLSVVPSVRPVEPDSFFFSVLSSTRRTERSGNLKTSQANGKQTEGLG